MKKIYPMMVSGHGPGNREITVAILFFIMALFNVTTRAQESVTTEPPLESGNVVNICQAGSMVLSVHATNPAKVYTLSQTGVGTLESLPGNGGTITFSPVIYSTPGSFSHLVLNNDFSFFMTFTTVVWDNPVAPALLTDPPPGIIEAGTPVSAAVGSPGSGGYQCNDSYEYRILAGTTWDAWQPYIPGTPIPTVSIRGVQIRSLRNNSEVSRGCSSEMLYSWDVYAYSNISDSPVTHYPTLQEAIDAPGTTAGETIRVAEGTYPLDSATHITKPLIIRGSGDNGTRISHLTFSGAIDALVVEADQVTIENLDIEKQDETGPSSVVSVAADQCSIRFNQFFGHFDPGETDEVSGILVSEGSTGLIIDTNFLYSLRWPATLYGSSTNPTSGTIAGNTVFGTDGWQVSNADMLFSGNIWNNGYGYNVLDIVILPGTSLSFYPDIVSLSSDNNNAVIEDQRVVPAVLSRVFTNPGATLPGNGGILYPYPTIQQAVDRVVPEGTIKAGVGQYHEQVTIHKSLTLSGDAYWNNYLVAPPVRANSVVEDTVVWDYILGAWSDTGPIRVTIENFSIIDSNRTKMPGTDFLTGIFLRNLDGSNAGVSHSFVGGFPASPPAECYGITLFGNSTATLDNLYLETYSADGILVRGSAGDPSSVSITNNHLNGSASAGNGIHCGPAVRAMVDQNYFSQQYGEGENAGYAVLLEEADSSVVSWNSIGICKNGIGLIRSDALSVTDNYFGGLTGIASLMDEVNHSVYLRNSVEAPDPAMEAGLVLRNGCDENLIGSEGNANGFRLADNPAGTGICLWIEGSTGSGSNVISYNSFAAGKRSLFVEPGVSGTTIIDHNGFAGVVSDSGSVVVNGGNSEISNNIFGAQTIRGILIDGAHDVDIHHNNFTYGSSDYAIRLNEATGSKTVHHNVLFALTGTGFIGGAGADDVIFNCNTFQSGGADIGMIMEEGCTGATITSNYFQYIAHQCILAHTPLPIVVNNFFTNSDIGIETWGALNAHNNLFRGCTSGAVISHSDELLDITNNWWGWAGPRVPLGDTVLNSYYLPSQVETIFSASANMLIAPWLNSETDFLPDSCGFHPLPDASYAPVFANADGSANETEQYGSVSDAVNRSALPFVFAKAGFFHEQILIDRDLTLTGKGINVTRVVAPDNRSSFITHDTTLFDYIVAAQAPSGTINVRIDSLTVLGNNSPKNPGTDFLSAIMLKDIEGPGAGVFHSSTSGFPVSVPNENYGLFITGDADVTLDSLTLNDYTADAIRVESGTAMVRKTICSGNALSGDGIHFGDGTVGTVENCYIANHPASGSAAVHSYGDSLNMDNSHTYNCNLGVVVEAGTGQCMLKGNQFDAGSVFVLAGESFAGTMIADSNLFGYNKADSVAILLHGGEAVITRNNFYPLVETGIILDGTTGSEIRDNQFSTLLKGVAVDLKQAEGTNILADNTIYASEGLGFHAGIVPDSLIINCNEFWNTDTAIIISINCPEPLIRNNVFAHVYKMAVAAYGPVNNMYGNLFEYCPVGIASWNTLTAWENTFNRSDSGAMVFYSDHYRDVTNNNWQTHAGPRVYLNGINVNSYNQHWQTGEFIQANTFGNFTWAPYLLPSYDINTDSCGFQPDPGNSFAPVYANADSSATETERYGTIQEAVSKTSLPFVFVKPGSYNEQVLITKSLVLSGAGYAGIYLYPPLERTRVLEVDTTSWDYLLAADAPTGTIDVKIFRIILDMGFRTKIPGADQYSSLIFRNVAGSHAGIKGLILTEFNQSAEESCNGMTVFGNSLLYSDSNYFYNPTGDAIRIAGGEAMVTRNYVYGSPVSGNGIVFDAETRGEISTNNTYYHTGPDSYGIMVSCDSIPINANNVYTCTNGIKLKNVHGVPVTSNTVYLCSFHGLILDNAVNCLVQDNWIDDQLPEANGEVILLSGSTGNLIGGENHGNHFVENESGPGDNILVHLDSSVGEGTNTISYNTFGGGKRGIFIGSGVTGSTLIEQNSFSASEEMCVGLNGGNNTIQNNFFGSNTIRGILIDGAGHININNNFFNYGSSDYAIRINNASGSKTITENTFFGLSGTALIAGDGADDFIFNCNSFKWGGANTGLVIDSGCTGAIITNNYFMYIANQCIKSYAPLLTVSNNFFHYNGIGIETWSELNAHENSFAGCANGAMIFHTNDPHDVRNNSWYYGFGPRVYLNGVNVNTFYPTAGKPEFIEAYNNDNFLYAPYMSGEDSDPLTCGYQPDPATSYAPVYANTDGSSTETEQYPTIADALRVTALPYIRAKAGYFNEKPVITAAVDLQGVGIDQSFIDARDLAPGNVVDISFPAGEFRLDGFTLLNNDTQDMVSAGSPDTASQITLSNIYFHGTGTPGLFDHGILNKPGNKARFEITANYFNHLYNHPVMFSRNEGSSRIYRNTFEGIFPSLAFLTNGGTDVTNRQQVDSNTFNLWISDTTRYNSAISFTGAYRADPAISQGSGRFSDILIHGNRFNDIPQVSQNQYTIIQLKNDDPDGTGGEITGATVSNNYFNGVQGSNIVGIGLDGMISGAVIDHNEMHKVITGIRCRSTNHGAGILSPVNTLISDNYINCYGAPSSRGIDISRGSATITDNPVIAYFTYGLSVDNGAFVRVVNNMLYYNTTGVDLGQESDGQFVGNKISYNGTGMNIHDNSLLDSLSWNELHQNTEGGILVDASSHCNPMVHNTISYNGFIAEPLHGIGLKNENPTETIDARYNYWGGWPYQEPNYTCGDQNAIIGKVDFLPILDAPGGDSLFPKIVNITRQPNSYYCKIQDAIDDAEAGDEIHIGEGSYTEQLTIGKSLKLFADPAHPVYIFAPETRTGTISEGGTTWDYLVAATAPSGTIDVSLQHLIFFLDYKHKMAGTDKMAGVFLRDVNGQEAGIHAGYIAAFPQDVTDEGYGAIAFGDCALTIDSTYVYSATGDGISIQEGTADIFGNIVYGSEISGNGIVMNTGTEGTLWKNYSRDCNGPNSFGMIVRTDSILISQNQITANRNGLLLQNANYVTFTENMMQDNYSVSAVLDNVQQSVFTDNGIQNPSGEAGIGMRLLNGSSGNLIGSEGHGNGILLHLSGSGPLIGLHIDGSVGSGSNTISHNVFSGGNYYVKIDAGNTGTTIIDNNGMGWAGAVACGVLASGGNVVISNNGFGSGNIRGILIDGANDAEIHHNTMSYGIPDYGIKVNQATGTKSVHHNTIGIEGKAVVCGEGADNLTIQCNFLGGYMGIEIEGGCTGVSVINNTINYCAVNGISTGEALYGMSGNQFYYMPVCVEAWNDLEAHQNIFHSFSESVIIHASSGNHDLTENYWGYYGPVVLYNSKNLNTYFRQYQGLTLRTENPDTRFAPWLQTNTDANPDSCGFQPDPGYLFAPVYANNDGSATETEQYGSIHAGIGHSALPYVFVKQGEFTEQVAIHRDVTLTGAGVDYSLVFPPTEGRITVPGYSGSTWPGTPWNSDFLLAACPADPDNGAPIRVKVSGFSFDAQNQFHSGDRMTGAFFRKVYADDPADAGLFNSHLLGFNTSDPNVTGVAVLDGSKLSLSGLVLDHYSEQGVMVQGTDNLADPLVMADDLTLNPPGYVPGIRYTRVNGSTTAGAITGSTINGGPKPILAELSDHLVVSSNEVLNSEDAGITLQTSNHCSVTNNTVSDFVSHGIAVYGDHNLVSDNTIHDVEGYSQSGIYLNNANQNTVTGNTVYSIHSGNTWEIGSCASAIGIAGTSSGNSIGTGLLSGANEVSYNDAGIVFYGNGSGNSARGNLIHHNNPHGLNNIGGAVVDATRNWWGISSGPSNGSLNPCGSGDALTDPLNVTFEPWVNDDQLSHEVYMLVPFTVSGPDSACTNVETTITLSGSQVLENGADYGYSLYKDGSWMPGSEKQGTGSALSWTIIENSIGTWNYTVKAINLLSGCELEMTGMVTITFVPGPGTPGAITGPVVVSPGQSGLVYTTNPVAGAMGYEWSLPPGATITAGANTNSITVSFGLQAYTGNMKVAVLQPCGRGGWSPALHITVNLPTTLGLGSAVVSDTRCYNALQTITVSGGGNTYTVAAGANVSMVAGQKVRLLPKTIVQPGGYFHAWIASGGNYCASLFPSMVQTIAATEEPGNDIPSAEPGFRIYPNPTTGRFTLELSQPGVPGESLHLDIFGIKGEMIRSWSLTGERRQQFSLENVPAGLYFVKLSGNSLNGVGKLIKQ